MIETNYSNNIYKCSLISRWTYLVILSVCVAFVAIFTGIAHVAPQLITFSAVVDETKCQNELNVQCTTIKLQGTQEEFREVLNNNLVCFFCHHLDKELFGIKGVLLNQPVPIDQTQITYTIGFFDEENKHSCWYDAAQNEEITQLPKLVSNFNDKQVEIQSQTSIFHWECTLNITSYTCYTKEHIFDDNRAYARLFGFIKVQGIQYDYMNFAIVTQEESYYQYNEVMLIVWVGIELVFGCILCLMDEEFKQDSALIPTLSVRVPLFAIMVLNNHPLFIIQLFYDNLYLKIINVLFLSLAQSCFLFYSIQVTQRILEINFLLIPNIILCILYAFFKSFITITQALDMMQSMPTSALFIEGQFSYFALLVIILFVYFICFQLILFIKSRRLKAIQISRARNDTQMKMSHKFYKGIRLYQIFITLSMSGFFARIMWQNLILFNSNYLYYDHYQITLINVWVFALFILFYLENPTQIHQVILSDQEEIEFKQAEIQQSNNIQLEEEQIKLHEPVQTVQDEIPKTMDTNLRAVNYKEIAQPETQLRN